MAETLLRIAGLSRRFGGLAALDGVDLEVAAGEVHALIGPNGAGKTTLVNVLCGALRADAGTIRFEGEELAPLPMHRRVARGLARSYQATSLFERLCVLDNVALAVQARFGSSLRFWRPAALETAWLDEARSVLERVGLGDRADAIAGRLSHGEKRRLELAIALATRPKLLLLDEPTAGMEPAEAAHIVEMLARLRGSVTLLLVEHDMPTVFRLADRISVLAGGRVIASGAPAAIRAHPEVRDAYLGHEASA